MHHNAASAAYAGQHHPQQTTNQQQQSYPQQQSQFGPISGGHYDHHHHAAAALAAQQQQQRHHQEHQQQQQYSYNTPETNYQVEQQQQQQQSARAGQNPSIRWQQSNGSGTPPTGTTAERRLPFVHRFHRGSNQQQANQGSSTNVLIAPYHHSGQQGGSNTSQHSGHSGSGSGQQREGGNPSHAHSHHRSQASYAAQQLKQQEKRARNMAQYETNPIGALQERFQSRGIIPDYKFLNTDGASHCPTFTFQVTVGDITASGNGQTKKQAKQAAAKSMLDILDGRAPSGGDANAAAAAKPATDGTNGEAGKEGAKAVENGKKPAAPQVGNKIGMLQEFCVTKGLPMPVYEVQNVGGQPHQRVFTILVKVGSLALTGEGTSKKESKREAATKMYDKLKELGAGALPMIAGGGAKLEPGSHPDNSDGFKGIDTLTGKGRDQISKFFGELTVGKNSVMHSLHRSGATVASAAGPNYVKFLKDLAEEQKFAVTYVEMDEPVEGGGVMSLAQISSMPVAVCNGVGATLEAANNEAARSALLYLKMMTKKKATGPTVAEKITEGQATEANSKANGQRKKK